MLVSELIVDINDALRGDEVAPTSGSEEYSLWLRTANRKLREWARDPKNRWSSLFELREMGAVSATQTYEMDEDFLSPSDKVIVSDATNDYEFQVVKPQERADNKVYFSGRLPVILTFHSDIEAHLIGGTLKVPAYYIPDDLATANDEIPVDDPNWLTYATSAEIAFNDVTYEDKYPDLIAKANALYMAMSSANRKGTYSNPRIVPTAVNRIRGMEIR